MTDPRLSQHETFSTPGPHFDEEQDYVNELEREIRAEEAIMEELQGLGSEALAQHTDVLLSPEIVNHIKDVRAEARKAAFAEVDERIAERAERITRTIRKVQDNKDEMITRIRIAMELDSVRREIAEMGEKP